MPCSPASSCAFPSFTHRISVNTHWNGLFPRRVRRPIIGRMDTFSPELVGILAVGVALAALVLRQGARLDRRIDLLAAHMNEGFQRIDERFRRIDEWFQRIDERFQRIDEQFRMIEARLRDLGEGAERLEDKIDPIEGFIVRRNEPSGAAVE